MKKFNGIWFYGLSGSGKTYASKILKLKKKNSILVDGDVVRKLVSFDLGYELKDREIQILRMYGISQIIINSGYFPIISTVYFNKKLEKLCKISKILPILIKRRDFNKVKSKHKTYKNIKNVVGKDLKYPNLKTLKIFNNNKKNFILKSKFLSEFEII